MSTLKAIFRKTWLIVTFNVWNDTTWAIDFTWNWVEVSNTWAYNFSFTEAPNINYTWIASTPWLQNITWSLFATWGSWWTWISVSDIWGAQISDYDDTPWSFANKFSQYGWVSHVIDRSSLDDASKLELKWFKDKMEEFAKTLKDFKSNEKDFNNIVEAIKNQPNKTTIVNKGWQYEETIWELLVESIPQLMDKLDEATQMIPLYEELINYMEQREKDWEQLVQDIIDNQ